MSNRIRDTVGLLESVEEARGQIETLLSTAKNTGWTHDHVGVLNSVVALLNNIHALPSDQSLRRNLGRLVTDNNGIEFTPTLQSLLLKISTANLRQ